MSDQKPNRILELIRNMPSLGEIFFFGKLAKLFRAIALWRKQRKLRKALRQEQRRRFILETLEPRVLLSADITYGAASTVHDMTLIADHSTPDTILKLVETGNASNVLGSVILDDSGDINVKISRDTTGALNGDRVRIDLNTLNILDSFVSGNGGVLNINIDGGSEAVADDHVNLQGTSATLGYGLHVTSSSDLVIGVGNLTVSGDFHIDAKDSIGIGASKIDAQTHDIGLVVSSTSDGILGSGLLANSSAAITIDGGWLTGHDINIEAKSTVHITPTDALNGDAIHLSIATSNSSASVIIKDDLAHVNFAKITASGNLTVHALSDVTVNAVILPDSTGTNTNIDAAAATTIVTSSSKVGIEGNSALNATAGEIHLNAENKVDVTTTANAANAAKGAAVAVTYIDSDTTAYMSGGSAATAHSVELNATSKSIAATTAISAAEGATSSGSGTGNKSEQALQDPNNDGNSSDRAASSSGNLNHAGTLFLDGISEIMQSGDALLFDVFLAGPAWSAAADHAPARL